MLGEDVEGKGNVLDARAPQLYSCTRRLLLLGLRTEGWLGRAFR